MLEYAEPRRSAPTPPALPTTPSPRVSIPSALDIDHAADARLRSTAPERTPASRTRYNNGAFVVSSNPDAYISRFYAVDEGRFAVRAMPGDQGMCMLHAFARHLDRLNHINFKMHYSDDDALYTIRTELRRLSALYRSREWGLPKIPRQGPLSRTSGREAICLQL